MFQEVSLVESGALAGYGSSFFAVGRAMAKPVKSVLTGTKPSDLPVQTFNTIELHINARTAAEIGLTIPRAVIMRADKVIK